jgi:hypothetical protein
MPLRAPLEHLGDLAAQVPVDVVFVVTPPDVNSIMNACSVLLRTSLRQGKTWSIGVCTISQRRCPFLRRAVCGVAVRAVHRVNRI